MYWFLHPSSKEIKSKNLDISHWSFFEHWSNYKHYMVAKEKCGLVESNERGLGTYDNYSASDTYLVRLYYYLMYLKFGFGRTTHMAGLDIREGSLTRDQGLNLVKKYDSEFPEKYVDLYLDYYKMNRNDFDDIIDKFANKDLFSKKNGVWTPLFTPK